MNGRGASPVLGLALLLGLVAVASVSLLLVGSVVLDDTRSDAATKQVERSMTELASSAEHVAEGEADRSSFTVQGADEGTRRLDPDAGSYEVRIERNGTTEVLSNGSMGAYEYAAADGTRLAFQGGGVWRAEGGARMVSAPQFHYRSRPEPTLTLPVVRLTGDATAPSRGDLAVVDRSALYPVRPNHTNPLQEGVVYVEVGSEYCGGWEQFFQERTDGALVEGCAETGRTGTDEVLVVLSVPFRFGGLGGHTVIAEDVTGNGVVHGSVREGSHDHESVSGVVDRKVEACADGDGSPLGRSVAGGGLYCAASMSGDYDVDTRGEDVEIAVDGPVDPDELDIAGDGTVTIFARGHVLPMPSGDVGDPADPEQLRILVHSDHQVGVVPGGGPGPGGPGGGGGPGAGNLDLYGLVYAPNSVVSFAGNADVHGGVVADRVHLQSGSSSVHPDPDVGQLTLSFERGGEPFYYLHVSETTLSVESDGS